MFKKNSQFTVSLTESITLKKVTAYDVKFELDFVTFIDTQGKVLVVYPNKYIKSVVRETEYTCGR